MELTSTLLWDGWTIKYSLWEPSLPAASSSITTICFVHGTPWSSVVFEPLARGLLATNRYRVLLYDLPGYGLSQHFTGTSREGALFAGDTSVKAQGKALAELLKSLNLDGMNGNPKPAVIAHDIAGAIALRTHLIHGCEFGSLMLWDTNAVLPWGDGFYKLARSEPQAFLEMPPHIFEAVVRAVISSGCHNPKKLVPNWEDALAQPWISNESTSVEQQRSFVRQIAQANDADVAEMLDQNLYSQVQCPVKILWGEQDGWIPREKMDRLAEMLRHCLQKFVVVPDAGHLLMIDQPERVAVEVSEWLDQQRL